MEQKLMTFLLNNDLIQDEEKEIYAYGLNKLKGIVINIITTLSLGALMGMFVQSALFLICYIPLRRYAGGYHAPGAVSCLIMSLMLTFFWLLCVKFITADLICIICVDAAAAAVIFLRAPVESRNNPLTDRERTVFRCKARAVTVLQAIAAAVLCAFSYVYAAKCIVFTLMAVALLTLFPDKLNRR